ncbi:MAG: phospholipase D-like domain-containing protein [Pirellulales bacterium]|nr:phospholipase D-like domain-containing protein [Pirellulales bacterium]
MSELEEALKITLADYRLSRGEKRALAKVIEKHADNERLLALARQSAFKLAREELGGPAADQVVDWLEDVLKLLLPKDEPAGDTVAEAFFSPDDHCVGKIIRLFQAARKSVDVCVFTITDDRIKEAILEAHHRKISVRIISDDDKSQDRGSDIEQLDRRGVPVRVDRSEYHMHHKYAVFDNRRLLTGSYNWTRSAAQNNEENFIVTSDARLVKAFGRAFEGLWKQLG